MDIVKMEKEYREVLGKRLREVVKVGFNFSEFEVKSKGNLTSFYSEMRKVTLKGRVYLNVSYSLVGEGKGKFKCRVNPLITDLLVKDTLDEEGVEDEVVFDTVEDVIKWVLKIDTSLI